MTDRTKDEALIREVVAHAAQAWDDNDATAYAAEFTEDSDYVAFDGTLLRGREANRALHAGLFDGVLYGTRMDGAIESIRFLTDDVAVVHGTGSVVFAWQREVPKGRRSRNTWVLVRTADGWQVAAFHNTRVRPVPGEGPVVRLFGNYVRWRTERARANQ
ncbi:SgcJ/EcaC family oxidoreductase [Nocardia lijiangensis]|uniref:SgcJ/EcaC family oxidoreductase n=1 Tax=Nocardia lijiangensis TaxID=299618 RepID=UPI00082FD4B9|nr:SgcJ/EcaC family oxidoreductase [Nocardia lijiangensis]